MKIGEFVRWCIQESAWSGNELSGDDVQEQAIKCGLLVKTKYDPDIHGEPACDFVEVERGDDWYIFPDELKAIE